MGEDGSLMAAYNSPTYERWLPGVEVDHVGAAREHLRAVLPEANLAPSSVEMTLVEALAVLLGPVTMSYQMAPAAVLEHLMGMYGLYRHGGRPAEGKAVVRAAASAPTVQIPPNTVLRHFLDDQAGTLEFRTTEALTIYTTDSVVGEVHIEATENGTSHNGLGVRARLDPTDYLIDVDYIEVAVETRAGEDPESDASFEERAMAMLARQSTALNHSEQFGAAALTREEVGRVSVVDNWDPTGGALVDGAPAGVHAVGHVTVAVTDVTGRELLDPADRENLQRWLQDQALASLQIHVIDPTYTLIDLEVTVEAAPATNHAEVETAVLAELRRRLDPLAWNWWNTVTAYDLTSWIDDVTGVARVIAVPTAGITLDGVAPLPQARNLKVNVNPSTR